MFTVPIHEPLLSVEMFDQLQYVCNRPFLFHTHFTFRINKEIMYSQYICQCCGKIGVFFRVKKFAFYKKKGCFSTPISVE